MVVLYYHRLLAHCLAHHIVITVTFCSELEVQEMIVCMRMCQCVVVGVVFCACANYHFWFLEIGHCALH